MFADLLVVLQAMRATYFAHAMIPKSPVSVAVASTECQWQCQRQRRCAEPAMIAHRTVLPPACCWRAALRVTDCCACRWAQASGRWQCCSHNTLAMCAARYAKLPSERNCQHSRRAVGRGARGALLRRSTPSRTTAVKILGDFMKRYLLKPQLEQAP